MQWTISGNEQETLENMNHFCGILLKLWSEGGRKDRFRSEFNATTLGSINRRRYRIYGKTRPHTVTGADMSEDLFL
jgi:hypothetical protein